MFRTRIDWTQHLTTIRQMSLQGSTLAEIGRRFGVSRQRIKQIMNRYGLKVPGEFHGKQVFTHRAQKEAWIKHRQKWGLTPEQAHLKKTAWYQRLRQKYRQKKTDALRRGIEWSIEMGDVEFPDHCPVLGLKLDYAGPSKTENHATLCRLDDSKGFVAGNVVVLSWRASQIKNTGTAEEHRRIADFIDSLTKISLDKIDKSE